MLPPPPSSKSALEASKSFRAGFLAISDVLVVRGMVPDCLHRVGGVFGVMKHPNTAQAHRHPPSLICISVDSPFKYGCDSCVVEVAANRVALLFYFTVNCSHGKPVFQGLPNLPTAVSRRLRASEWAPVDPPSGCRWFCWLLNQHERGIHTLPC